MKSVCIFLVITSLFTTIVFSQSDTLVVFDCQTQLIDFISTPPPNSNRTSEHTAWDFGQSPGIAELHTQPPAQTMPESGFTELSPAAQQFDVRDFPVCTAVKLVRFVSDTLEKSFTGTMVGPDLVLTCVHGVYDFFEEFFYDSILAIPAYDFNHQSDAPLYGTSISKKYYFPKSIYDLTRIDDVALIQLQAPLGLQCGWMGIAFQEDDDFFNQHVVHRFCYPRYDDLNETRFNGDTLFYSYGKIDLTSKWNFYLYGRGIYGESGSNIFYTDNQEYYAFSAASRTGSDYFIHSRITQSIFYAFKNVIENSRPTTIAKPERLHSDFILHPNYPNPFNAATTIQYTLEKAANVTLRIYNIMGQEIAILADEFQTSGKYCIHWQAKGLPSGIYLCRLQTSEFSKTQKLILQK